MTNRPEFQPGSIASPVLTFSTSKSAETCTIRTSHVIVAGSTLDKDALSQRNGCCDVAF
jgi:hypothetical protein